MDFFDAYLLGALIVVVWVFLAVLKAFGDRGADLRRIFGRGHRSRGAADAFGLSGQILGPALWGPIGALRLLLGAAAALLAGLALHAGQLPQAIFYALATLMLWSLVPAALRRATGVAETGLALFITAATMLALSACARASWRRGDPLQSYDFLRAISEEGADFGQGLLTGFLFGYLDLLGAPGQATSPVFDAYSFRPDTRCLRHR